MYERAILYDNDKSNVLSLSDNVSHAAGNMLHNVV